MDSFKAIALLCLPLFVSLAGQLSRELFAREACILRKFRVLSSPAV